MAAGNGCESEGHIFYEPACGPGQAEENQEQGGIIINVASKAGVAGPLANHAAYAASKAGVVGFTRECAREFAELGIRVHAVVVDEPAEATAVAHTILALCTDPNFPTIL